MKHNSDSFHGHEFLALDTLENSIDDEHCLQTVFDRAVGLFLSSRDSNEMSQLMSKGGRAV